MKISAAVIVESNAGDGLSVPKANGLMTKRGVLHILFSSYCQFAPKYLGSCAT